MRREKTVGGIFGETEQRRHHQMDKISEPAALRPLRGEQVNPKYGQSTGRQFYTHISVNTAVLHLHNQSGQGFSHVLDGLLYHEKRHGNPGTYTDTAGFTVMSLP